MGNCTSTSEKEKSSSKTEGHKQAKPNLTADESTKSSSYKNNGSKTFRKQELAESTIMSTFTADNTMKEKEYSRYMEKVKDFNPRVRRVDLQQLKLEILAYIDSKTNSTRSEFDHFYGEIARGCMKQTPDNKFTESLNYIAWHFYTVIRQSQFSGQTVPVQDQIGIPGLRRQPHIKGFVHERLHF